MLQIAHCLQQIRRNFFLNTVLHKFICFSFSIFSTFCCNFCKIIFSGRDNFFSKLTFIHSRSPLSLLSFIIFPSIQISTSDPYVCLSVCLDMDKKTPKTNCLIKMKICFGCFCCIFFVKENVIKVAKMWCALKRREFCLVSELLQTSETRNNLNLFS